MDADAELDLDEIVDALYLPHPAGFTAARDEAAARVKEAGDPAAAKRIAALRRPTLAAWASNTLVRAKPDETEQFLQLGQTLRAAHRSLDGERLRDLSHQQHVVIGALAREAARLAEEAGTPVSEAVVRELERILHAVLADPDAAREWASGRLVRAPAPVSEFPAVDPAVALPLPGPPTRPVREPEPEPWPGPEPEPESGREPVPQPGSGSGPEPESGGPGTAAQPEPPADPARAARIAAARAAAEDAAWAVSAREEELRLAEVARQHAVARAADADAAVERLLGEAEQARAARDGAYAAVSEAEARHREADRAARAARLAAAAAQRRLRRL
ncbi:hypothetical protein [Streptomyces sp. W1SF4]|uniref:hypothetical protein n=1 Tax=Streptomyces sp. W1SF4 TaxID=2305220 RepID=UPI000F6D719C|nr:hypothetical protein [Streptomyces sp. W1SF4]AZM87678.1 hypothetical protein D1J60_03525 [Streptomyces sp. W1SF4]